MAELATTLISWHACHLVAGHGVASGRAPDSPYPGGSISLQMPHFARLGLDLSDCYGGTLNLMADAHGQWRLSHPSWCFEQLTWTDQHPAESFSFWPCLLRWQGNGEPIPGWIYWPHPETKLRHFQPSNQLEVLAPWIDGIHRAEGLELGVDRRRCQLLETARLRAQLLEHLKFRVLAAQEDFFGAFAGSRGLEAFRGWLRSDGQWPWAEHLSDPELAAVLEQARQLYLD